MLNLLLALPLLASLATQGQAVVQEYYIPMPEAQLRDDYLALASTTSSTATSVASIVVLVAGTRIIYDHWEDGYEVDLNNPTSPKTEIWGDGNDANGKPPGFLNDPVSLPAGTAIVLKNDVALPRNPATFLFDGRDRIGSSQALAVTRAAWFTTPGPLLADACAINATTDWGTSFVMPVGENIIFPTPLTASMFEHVAMFVMASQNGTSVQIDKDGNGTVDVTVALNQGESYLINGGILAGATVVSTKPVQVVLDAGDIGANYESRWYYVTPTARWGSVYYSPVGTAANGEQTYVYLYNPDAAGITVNYTTLTGTGTISVGAKTYAQFLMPQNSGARFTSVGNKPFYAVAAVGAAPTSNNVHDWGFALVPESSLTTEVDVGWGPGSLDGTQNGNPLWVTATANTTLYVDYNGKRNGLLTDPQGGKYDLAITTSALAVQRIYDPTGDKDQTGMRVYTLDGTLITAAWGQDPAVAGPGLPYLDMGTTVPNIPVPVLHKTVSVVGGGSIAVGVTLEYTITFENKGIFILAGVNVVDTMPAGLQYVVNSTTRDSVAVPDVAGTFPLLTPGYTIPLLQPGAITTFKYRALVQTSGTKVNTVTAGTAGTTQLSRAADTVVVPGTPTTQCNLKFTTSTGTVASSYSTGAGIYVTMTDPDANTDAGTTQTFTVLVQNTSNGDVETITLTEVDSVTGATSVNSSVFRNLTALPSSIAAGGFVQDGTLLAVAGNTLSVNYTDPLFGDVCSSTATVAAVSNVKQLYLNTDGSDGDTTGALDRVDPVNTSDASMSSTSVLAGASSGSVSVGTTASNTSGNASASSLQITGYDPGSGSNRLMMVSVSIGSSADLGGGSVSTVSSVRRRQTITFTS